MPNEQDDKTRRIPPVKKEFSKAATGKLPPPPPMPPELNLSPPGPLGPGMGSRSPGQSFHPPVSPALREQTSGPNKDGPSTPDSDRPKPPLKPTFNREARKGALRSVFEKKARDPGPELEP